MINFFSNINLTSIGAVNLVIQALLFEIAIFLAVPLLGILVESILVRGVRGILARLLGHKGEFIFSNYILCIGVVIHELSHAFFALITGAKIVEVALFKPEGNSLGHVTFQTRGNTFTKALQSSFSASAPVVVGMIISALLLFKIFPIIVPNWLFILVLYVFVAVVFHMNMSKPDLKAYFKGTFPLLAIFLPISIIAFIIA